jgi:hypothetical protein
LKCEKWQKIYNLKINLINMEKVILEDNKLKDQLLQVMIDND